MEDATHSLSARRRAATGLPQFHLPQRTSSSDPQVPSMANPVDYSHYPSPPPTISPSASRPPTSSPHFQTQNSLPTVVGGKHLTSRPGVTGSEGLSPLASSVNSSSSQSSQAAISPYTTSYNNSNWPAAGGTSSYTHAPMNQAHHNGLAQPHSYYNRAPLYSPTAPPYNPRNSQSPATGEGLAPPYDHVPQPFPAGASGHSSSFSQSSPNQPLHHAGISSQPPTPSTAAPSDGYPRPPPQSGYYGGPPPSSTPQQTSYHSYAPAPPSHTQPSSTTTTGPMSRPIPALASQQQSHMSLSPAYTSSRPGFGYQHLPPGLAPGPVLSNMANPGGPPLLMNSLSHQVHAYSGHHMGPHQAVYPPGANQQDRPYKCDQCPTAFSRNHDLKRHKRIHMEVKPYPCTNCEKAFSRKDALKRHLLVKGCGGDKARTSPKSTNGASPREPKSDADGTPNRIKDETV
ncbi:hypothetical protein F4780DRAFT_469299 [Xylariomycetidae sp. FL0641]|nr:hypothetical protein F4780DRAFT_469299 [Xylariomycetidae sp. FL0641]